MHLLYFTTPADSHTPFKERGCNQTNKIAAQQVDQAPLCTHHKATPGLPQWHPLPINSDNNPVAQHTQTHKHCTCVVCCAAGELHSMKVADGFKMEPGGTHSLGQQATRGVCDTMLHRPLKEKGTSRQHPAKHNHYLLHLQQATTSHNQEDRRDRLLQTGVYDIHRHADKAWGVGLWCCVTTSGVGYIR